jgi:CheY-like chemotaxis protein/nitrogen-specific signal transduction histidine kinase
VVLTLLRDSSGKVRGFSKVTRDITDQIRNREMEAAKIVAEKANKSKDDFLAALSHELRTPLTPALAAADFLADNAEQFPSEFSEELDTIRRNVKLQARLIDDLLDLTRVTRGKIELHFERVDAHTVVRDALNIAQNLIDGKQLKVATHLEAKEHHIWADPIRIQQVFWNLLNNAAKFTGPGGKIDIRTSNDEHDHFVFEVVDDGIGIEAERQAMLFKPFEQCERNITRQFGGLGLGLAISKHLVDLHDGAISATSRGRSYGSTFKVALDIVKDRVGASGVRAQFPHKPSKSLRILLVEDHGDTRRTLSRLLTHFGHKISVADCRQSAHDIVQEEKFDVVLSDIGLPDGSGYDVISHAKQTQSLKGVALTGFGMEEDIQRSKDAGFDFHLTKPVDFHELRSVLDQAGE